VFDIGSSLRDARMRQEIDFPELEERTKIRPKYLRALEDEQFDTLPGPTYVKGFLRSYAEALGLDGQPFVDEYNSRFAVGDEDVVLLRTRRAPVQPRRGGGGTRESRLVVVVLAAIAVLTALVIAAWRFGDAEQQKVPGLTGSNTPTTTAEGPKARRVSLSVRAVAGQSWMQVRAGSVSGDELYSGTLERGQGQTFQGRRLHLTLSRPANVAVRVNGRRVALPAGTTFVVTRKIAPAAR
jgi:cytoskeleton protein RodZ